MSELKRYTINATSLDPTAAMFGPRSDDHPAKEDPDGLWCAAKDKEAERKAEEEAKFAKDVCSNCDDGTGLCTDCQGSE